MARLSKRGAGASKPKARKASPAKGRKTAKTKRQIAPAAAARKSRSVADLIKALREAYERDAATADILKVIASSPSDVQPVFDAIASSANRLIGGFSAAVYRLVEDLVHLVAYTPTNPEADAALKAEFPMRRNRAAPPVAWVANGEPVQIADSEAADPQTKRIGRARGWRSCIFTPLLNKGAAIGFITVTRRETGNFADHHVQLLRTFADQAVIAIENARLFNEVQAKTYDLEEALRYQTGSANILNVIASSPTDVQPILETIVKSACEFCEAYDAVVILKDRGELQICAHHGPIPHNRTRWPNDRTSTSGRAMADRRPIHVHDVLSDEGVEFPMGRHLSLLDGCRTLLSAPLLREGEAVGAIVLRRAEVHPFSDKQIALLQTFADQAAIAIGNVRLFDELQQRTDDLSESLQQQTATADVLKVISRSAFDLHTVLDALVASACRLCEADVGTIRYRDGSDYRLAATYGFTPEWRDHFARYSDQPDRGSVFGRTIVEGGIVHIPDVLADPEFARPEAQKLVGVRAALGVPLVREGRVFGVLSLLRLTPRPFTQKQIELVTTFADQAVIAIENVRLFEEVQARTEDLQEALQQQTATADVLKVISRSTFDLRTVLKTLVESAARLCDAEKANIFQRDRELYKLSVNYGFSSELEEYIKQYPLTPGRGTIIGRAVLEGRTIHVPDVLADPEYTALDYQSRGNWRSCLGVPLSRDGETLGIFFLTRSEVRPFTEKQIELVSTFADQAVIAIENARLFNETEEALERQTATADILKVIASSPSDVQPVFKAIASSANRLLGGHSTGVARIVEGNLHLAAFTPVNPEADAVLTSSYPMPTTAIPFFEQLAGGVPYQEPDVEAIPAEWPKQIARARGYRSLLFVPLMNAGQVIGIISVSRVAPGTFAAEEVQLLKTFADQAVIAIENTRLFNETREALERQTATADILKVIARTPSDVQPVFDAIAERANKLIGGYATTVLRIVGDMVELAAFTSVSEESDALLQAAFPIPIAGNPQFEMMRRGEMGEIVDTESEMYAHTHIRNIARTRGFRSRLLVPLKNDGGSIGAISVTRVEPGSFAPQHVQLLQTFADQAVIAIENVRLFNETQEALKHQTATSEVLQVIGRSMTDTQPVFERILDSTERLFDCRQVGIFLAPGDGLLHVAARRGAGYEAIDKLYPLPIEQTSAPRVLGEGRQVYFPDVMNGIDVPSSMRRVVQVFGNFSVVMTPMIWEGKGIGQISVLREPNAAFTPKELGLLRTFADQAVIAIENVRLFNETQDALAQQTATSEVLGVISNSVADTAPVFEKILDSCEKLFATEQLGIFLVQSDGQTHAAAWRGAALEPVALTLPRAVEETATGIVIRNRITLHIPKATVAKDMPASVRDLRDRIGDFSMAWAPMLGEEHGVGSIAVMRQPPNPFSEKELALLKTFADQAVIAIQNTRLFNETREALERQTATADILKVIASSPDDVQPVFEAIVASAARLTGAFSAGVYRFVDGVVHLAAITSTTPAGDEAVRARFPRPIHETGFTTTHAGEVFHAADTENHESPRLRDIARARGFRSIVQVPLKSSGVSIGAIAVSRKEAGPFAAHHIDLLQTFADQAVIAIENVRLFNETKEALEQQTATSEVLEIISSSPGELDPVFQKMLENACRVCEANFGIMQLWDGERFRSPAAYNVPSALAALRKNLPIRPHPLSGLYAAAQTHRVVHLHDVKEGQAYRAGVPNVVEMAEVGGARTLVIVPMLKEDQFIGAITIYRQEVRPFTDKQIALVENFTKQAVIAIENTRLLRELRERTDDLTRSLDDLRAAQDRLVQTEKLASLGQLTAGIAHEIKNPLNFVNNFSALSVELTDELNELLRQTELSDKLRTEVDELTELLRDNLGKVVQHGKRADSIVKNMLLHSREGSGERRSADINALVGESLNLAYHGARAEKAGFSITLKHDLDPDAGALDLYPQEMTRALLNLISNGFYAATRRKVEAGDGAFEPVLSAATRTLGKAVEIRIRDNGAGIPPEVKEKMFNPFFTTKPAGEGTGLGLSMTHDIIVKQHGGRIDVETKLGEFTEFIIVLPRDRTAAG